MLEKKQVFISEFYILIFVFMAVDFMRKTWFVLPGYCVGLGGLLLITYRTLLAIGSESKAVTVSVNRFGEQYLDLVALVFLWVVCLVGLLCLSSLAAEMERRERSLAEEPREGFVMKQTYSSCISDSYRQNVAPVVILESHEGLYSTGETLLSVDDGCGCFSVSVVVQQEGFQG